MKKLFIIVVSFLVFTAEIGLAQGLIAKRIGGQIGRQSRPNQQKQPQSLRPNVRPNAGRPVAIENLIEGFYVSRFPEMVEVGDEQFARILPLIRQGMRELREIAARKRRAMNQLVQMTQRGETDDNLRRMVQEVDRADNDYQTALQKFFSSVDPHLTPGQQARFRVFQDRIDQQIRQMINSVTNPPGQ